MGKKIVIFSCLIVIIGLSVALFKAKVSNRPECSFHHFFNTEGIEYYSQHSESKEPRVYPISNFFDKKTDAVHWFHFKLDTSVYEGGCVHHKYTLHYQIFNLNKGIKE